MRLECALIIGQRCNVNIDLKIAKKVKALNISKCLVLLLYTTMSSSNLNK